MSHSTKHARLEELAVKLIPAFRDKYDFSSPEHYDGLADFAFTAAAAFLKKADKLADEAGEKDRKEMEQAAKLAENTKEAGNV